jgi:hypothetical protein
MANSSPVSRGTGKKIYNHWKDAMVGVNPGEAEEYRAARVGCWRCGRDGHQSTECFAKTTKRGTPLPAAPTAAAATGKRKHEEEDDAAEDPAPKRADAITTMTQDDDEREVPLWEEDSEEDF